MNTTKKKVLIFSMSYFPRFVGGAEVALKELTDRLSDEFEFHMVTLRYDSTLPRTSQEGSVFVHRIGPSRSNPSISDLRTPFFRILKVWYQLGAFFVARRLHKQHAYSLIWAMMAHSAGVPAGLLKRFNPEVPYLLTLQEGDPPAHIERQMRVFGPLFRAAFVRADVVQTLSHFLASWATRMGARNVVVVPNGVDLTRFGKPVAPAKRSELRKRMGAKEDERLLITVSRLVLKNGIDVVIDALQQLPQHVRFAILGDGPEKERLVALAAKYAVSQRVTFLGEISQEDVPGYLLSADIFVRASRSEGQGISFIEAMASGLPTIGTSVGGIPDFLREGETGFVAEADSADSVASVVRRIIEQPIEAAHVAEGGQRLVRARYSWERIADEMRQLLHVRA